MPSAFKGPGGEPPPPEIFLRQRKAKRDAPSTPAPPSHVFGRWGPRCPKALEILVVAQRQATGGRRFFYLLCVMTSGLFTLCLYFSVTRPYRFVEHQWTFMYDVPLWGFQLFYIASIFNFCLAATIARFGLISKTILASAPFVVSVTISTAAAFYWVPIIVNNDAHDAKSYMLPASNVLATLGALYVDRDAQRLLREADEDADFADYEAMRARAAAPAKEPDAMSR